MGKELSKDPNLYVHEISQSTVRITPVELNYLLEATLKEEFINIRYNQKDRDIIPLFFCYYSERWYLLCLTHPSGKIFKFRLDTIQTVKIQKYKTPLRLNKLLPKETNLSQLKETVLQRINESKNIFVDLNETEVIKVQFRFYFSIAYLKKEIKHFRFMKQPNPNDDTVQEIELEFHGFEEAKTFLKKWLGKYSILNPEWLIDQFSNEMEESLDILRV